MTSHFSAEIAIIGAGPTGLFSVFECGMLGYHAHVFDALDHIGGQCVALYPEKPIFDIPAYPKISAFDLIQNLERQAAPFNPTYHLGQQVVEIHQRDTKGQQWLLKTSTGTEVTVQAIIIAAGVGAFGPNRPPLKGIEAYEKTSIHYSIPSRQVYEGRRVVIAGGGDSAIDWALSLSEIAQSVALVHRRDKFRASPESVRQLKEKSEQGLIELVIPFQLSGLSGEKGRLAHVEVTSLKGEVRRLEADFLLPFFGLSMALGPIAEWGLAFDQNHIRVNPTTLQTNRPGIYAVGDIATYPNKLKLILNGFGEAALAAHDIRRFLFPNEVFHFEYSTTKGMPVLSS